MIATNFYLASTRDQTDRTRDIRRLLEEQGACLLGPGLFVVSGVDLPDHCALMGVGHSTRVLLREDLTEGYAVRLGSFCTVRDLTLLGAPEDLPLPKQVSKRHGVLFEGDGSPGFQPSQPRNNTLTGLLISGFAGGGITCRETGHRPAASLTVSDCHILNCGAGINISRFSEYHKFTNVLCEECLFGCINNGGNNVFVNCGFNCNTTAFLMDNADGRARNNSHGSAVGCTFNHSDGNNGIGIRAVGMEHGFVFTGCQIFYSAIQLDNCRNFIFNALNTGRQVPISIRGGGAVLFSDCMFYQADPEQIQIQGAPLVRFSGCVDRNGVCVGP